MENRPKYTVGQLIEMLKEFPFDMPVITNGYEVEYESILSPKEINVRFSSGEPYYNGQFHKADDTDNDSFMAVVIEREVRS